MNSNTKQLFTEIAERGGQSDADLRERVKLHDDHTFEWLSDRLDDMRSNTTCPEHGAGNNVCMMHMHASKGTATVEVVGELPFPEYLESNCTEWVAIMPRMAAIEFRDLVRGMPAESMDSCIGLEIVEYMRHPPGNVLALQIVWLRSIAYHASEGPVWSTNIEGVKRDLRKESK